MQSSSSSALTASFSREFGLLTGYRFTSLIRLAVLSSLLALALNAHSETLDEAFAAALASHQQLAAAEARRAAAGYDLDRAQSERLPQLGVVSSFTQLDEAPAFDFGGGQTSQKLFANDNFVTAGAMVSVPLYAGGAIGAGIDSAEFAATASEGQLAVVTRDIKLGAGEHYVQVLRAESALVVADSNVAMLETLTADAKNRYDVGDVPKNDYLATSVSLANAAQRRLQAKNALDYARAAYNRFLNRPLDATVTLDPKLDIDGLVPAEDLDSLILMASQERDELTALGAQAQALRKQSAVAKAGSRPQFALTGGYMYLENQFLTADQFWVAGVSFQWNPFDGGRSRNRAAAFDSRANAVNHAKNDLSTEIALEVRRAWNDREEAESRARVTESAVEQAIENLRVVRDRYGAGASANVEVLDAEALRQQALSNHDNARYDLAIAKLRLARAVGTL